MAKRKESSKSRSTATLTPRDKKTLGQIVSLADDVVAYAHKKKDPYFDIPTRSLSNVKYNKTKRFIEMGGAQNRRQLFNLGRPRVFMQTLLVAGGCKKLIDRGQNGQHPADLLPVKHTIDGTNEETFDEQEECDPIIEDMEVMLESLREELHVFASNRGTWWATDLAQRLGRRRSIARGWGRAATAFRRSWSQR